MNVKQKLQNVAEKSEAQSQWISVEERLPELVTADGESDYVLVRYDDCIPAVAKYCTEEYHACPLLHGARKKRAHWLMPNGMWIRYNVTHWMPIPHFDDILEANKDVLKRLKEK